ncbi:hypothetical protein BDZ97DRAFT_2056971 [Flammula alnicola]|nr:hypothetical protein BDZ97DRAFT_2056971 [Flammula alnicola]
MRRGQLDDAETWFKRAIELYHKAQDVLAEGNSLDSLGDLCMRRDQLDDAETLFKHAIELYHKAQSILSEANGLWSLGDLHMQQEQLDEAETSFKRAIELYRQAQNLGGEGTAARLYRNCKCNGLKVSLALHENRICLPCRRNKETG